MAELRSQLIDIERQIREGKSVQASNAFRAIPRNPSREDAVFYAQLAQRLYLPLLALRALVPFIRPIGHKLNADPSDEELGEYGSSLVWLGAIEEGLEILGKVNPEIYPRALLYRAFALFSRWDYAGAAPLLESYVGLTEGYSKLTGQVNLASAYAISRQGAKARALINELREALMGREHKLLLGNVLETSAQLAVWERDYEGALRSLSEARDQLAEASGNAEFFVRKWQAVATALSSPGTESGMAMLRSIRDEARRKKHWETMRECDLFEAVGMRDDGLFLRVYFSTPFEAYKNRALAFFGRPKELPEHLSVQGRPGSSQSTVDVSYGCAEVGQRRVALTESVRRLLRAMTWDLYRPVNVGTLHSFLYPGEYFNPDSSPDRVRQAVHRGRKWLESEKVPITIGQEEGLYSIENRDELDIVLRTEEQPGKEAPVELEELRKCFGEKHFSARDASTSTARPLRTTVRLISDLVAAGFLQRVEQGRNVFYRIK